jgi:multidrug transporter EmrE-like cation transporter
VKPENIGYKTTNNSQFSLYCFYFRDNTMPKTSLVAIACMLVASVFGAVGQYFYKTGADHSDAGLWRMMLSPWILSGVACYIAVMFLFTQAFKAGGSVTVLYPIYATTFIWAALIAQFVYGQPIRLVHILGMIFLIGGMYLMGLGNAQPS